jgi:hypothetical protein
MKALASVGSSRDTGCCYLAPNESLVYHRLLDQKWSFMYATIGSTEIVGM